MPTPPPDPVHRAAREQAVLVAEAILDALLEAVAGLTLSASAQLRAEAGMPPRPEKRDPEEKPAREKKAPKPPPVDARLTDDTDARQGEYDPGLRRPTTPDGWRTAKVQKKEKAVASLAELAQSVRDQMSPAERERLADVERARTERARRPLPAAADGSARLAPPRDQYRGAIANAKAAAQEGRSADACPYAQGRGGFQRVWLETFRAELANLAPAGKGRRASGT